MKFKLEKTGLGVRLPDTRDRKEVTVKLFSTKPKGAWMIMAQSTQRGRKVKAKILLSTLAMCAVLKMFYSLTVKLGGAK